MRISKYSGTILCKVLLQEFQKGCGREPDLTAMRATRWGICTAGKISHDFCGAIRALPSAEHQVSLPVCLSVLAHSENVLVLHLLKTKSAPVL